MTICMLAGPTDAPNGTAGPNASGFPTLSKLFGTGATPATPIAPNPAGLRPIKTPHLEPISHPELAFSPSDIGVWEINKGAVHPTLGRLQLGQASSDDAAVSWGGLVLSGCNAQEMFACWCKSVALMSECWCCSSQGTGRLLLLRISNKQFCTKKAQLPNQGYHDALHYLRRATAEEEACSRHCVKKK